VGSANTKPGRRNQLGTMEERRSWYINDHRIIHASHYSCLASISSMKKAHRYIGLYNVPDMRAEIVHG